MLMNDDVKYTNMQIYDGNKKFKMSSNNIFFEIQHNNKSKNE